MANPLQELRTLESAESSGIFGKTIAYLKTKGPASWLALAALSAGCLIGSIGLGQRLGIEGLWVQPWAMLLGMFSLWIVSQITLNSQQSLFVLLRKEWNPSLAWWLAVAAMITNFAWCMPQFRLGADVAGSLLLPALDSKGGKILVACLFLLASGFLSFWYDRTGQRSSLIQYFLQSMLWLLCLLLLGVLLLVLPKAEVSLGSFLAGLLPNLSHFQEISSVYSPYLENIGSMRSYWEELLLSKQRELVLTTFSSTLGVNLIFALPLLLLGRGWKQAHGGFAKFNLFSGLLLPFALCCVCLTLLSAFAHQLSQTHGSTIKDPSSPPLEMSTEAHEILASRVAWEIGSDQFDSLAPLQQEELILALASEEKLLALLLPNTNVEQWIETLSISCNPLITPLLGAAILIMTFSTIVVLMILNGHLVCEVWGKAHKGAPFQSGSLALALASVGPFVWSQQEEWIADPTYFLNLAILPFALLSFLLMLNSRELMGRRKPAGVGGILLNAGGSLSFLFLGATSSYMVWNHCWGDFPVGRTLIFAIGVLLLTGYFSLRNFKLNQRISGLEARMNGLFQRKN